MWKDDKSIFLKVAVNHSGILSQIAKIESLEEELNREVLKLKSMVQIETSTPT